MARHRMTDEERKQRDIRERVYRDFERKPVASLLSILNATMGKTVVETLGDDRHIGPYDDYIHALIFSDGTGVMVEYTAEDPGYSSLTPGSPAQTEYFVLTPRSRS